MQIAQVLRASRRAILSSNRCFSSAINLHAQDSRSDSFRESRNERRSDTSRNDSYKGNNFRSDNSRDDNFRRDSYSKKPYNSRSRNSYSNSGNSRSYKGNSFSNNNRSRTRNFKDDDELLARTGRNRKDFGDGLMDKPDYELARSEEIVDLEWTDLIQKEDSEQPKTAGVSSVPTVELANRRLLSLPLVNSLIHNRKYEWLTPVQAQTLLPILKGESVVVRAKTGTGKTAAFAIPILQKVLEATKQHTASGAGGSTGKVHALIVSPTRELAQQIADEIFKITQFGGLSHIKVQSLVGGVAKDRQIKAAGFDGYGKVADVIVATPGRLVDVLGEGDIASQYFSNLSVRVLDEADQILDIGFEREMDRAREMIDNVSEKQDIPLLLFSATADRKMQKFAQKQFGDRVRVVDTVPKDEPTANELVVQRSVACNNWADVFEASSREIITAYEEAQGNGTHFKAIVFLPTTIMVDQYERILRRMFGRQSPISNLVLGIHGQRKQQSRQVRADRFRKEKDAVLITTDVVARGMDFPKVTHVFQLGPPPDVSSYVHRIGRTARIGNSGKSFLYYTNHMRGYVDALAREGIKPEMSVYETSEEFQSKLKDAFSATLDQDEAHELAMSLMSYMTVLKSKFNIVPSDFLRDMQPFVELLGLEELRLGSQMRQTWNSRGSQNRFQQRKGYGSSRRTKMRW